MTILASLQEVARLKSRITDLEAQLAAAKAQALQAMNEARSAPPPPAPVPAPAAPMQVPMMPNIVIHAAAAGGPGMAGPADPVIQQQVSFLFRGRIAPTRLGLSAPREYQDLCLGPSCQ